MRTIDLVEIVNIIGLSLCIRLQMLGVRGTFVCAQESSSLCVRFIYDNFVSQMPITFFASCYINTRVHKLNSIHDQDAHFDEFA